MYIESVSKSDIFSDLERIRYHSEITLPLVENKLPRHRKREWFLKGPIPWAWIEKAGLLPGAALLVGLTIWRLAGWQRKPVVTYSLSNSQPLSLQAARRGLRALEKAGLISIELAPGKASRITILKG
jgi:hypothetical protein